MRMQKQHTVVCRTFYLIYGVYLVHNSKSVHGGVCLAIASLT